MATLILPDGHPWRNWCHKQVIPAFIRRMPGFQAAYFKWLNTPDTVIIPPDYKEHCVFRVLPLAEVGQMLLAKGMITQQQLPPEEVKHNAS